jgi:protoporphyrinogen IX oxidase
MELLFLKAAHIIGFVAWFAGMFYLGRIFVYHKEAIEKNDATTPILVNQYGLMEWRVYKIIINPAMILTWVCGLGMLYIHGREWFKLNMWMHHKLLFLLLLTGYHGYCKSVIKKIQSNQMTFTSFQFRLFNEVPTVALFIIAPLAVFKNMVNPLLLILSTIAFITFLVLFTYVYKNYRLKNDK